jgi:feruloyl esterase
MGGGAQVLDLPSHCVVRGVSGAHSDKAGRVYGVKFELRMPADWNGRFLFQGGGGLDGAVLPAYGVMLSGKPGLARGFAVVSMDGGHEGPDASFASDQQARLDFAYQAVGKATAAAKALIRAYYATEPKRSYFVGCSNGGREAMIAAERYPMEFDGIVAGDPGFRLAHAAVGEAWANQHWAAVAPKDPAGRPLLASGVSEADLKLVADAVVAQCDALDGLKDGLINNVAACHFSPSKLVCKTATQTACIAPDKLAAIQAVFDGAHDSRGRPIYSGFPYDSGISQPGWRIWMLGLPGAMKALNETLGAQSLSLYFMTPQQPHRSAYEIDIDKAESDIAQTAALNDAVSTVLSSYAGHGGKLLIYQGVSDPVFSASDIEAWYDRLSQETPGTSDAARLFLIPGMAHCGGGVSTDHFDALTAVQDWVENNRAPERIIATGAALPGQSRPLCPYPRYARYTGGDSSQAESFTCADPSN